MKIGELASALEKLGKAYTNARKKDEPAPCILQVLKYLEGKEELDIEEVVTQAAEKKAAPRKPAKKTRDFNIGEHLQAIRAARSDGEFATAFSILKKANPTVAHLKDLLTAYTCVPRKSGKKDDLWRALEAAYAAAQRDERRGRIAAETLPI